MENADLMTYSKNVVAEQVLLATEPDLSCPVAVIFDEHSNNAMLLDLQHGVVSMSVSPNNSLITRSELSFCSAGNAFIAPCAIALSEDKHTTFIADSSAGAIFKVNSFTGEKIIISGEYVGNGPDFCSPESIVIESGNNRAIVVDSFLQAIFSVDLSSGDRIIISGEGTGTGPVFVRPRAVTLDTKTNTAFVADSSEVGIFSVDLVSGDRALVSCNGFFGALGEGPSFVSPTAVSFDPNTRQLFVLDAGAESLFSVDPVTGDRFTVSGGDFGNGPELLYPRSIALDTKNNQAFVIDSLQGALVCIDLDSGDRSIITQA